MYTSLNIIQAILFGIAAIAFCFIGYKFYSTKDSGFKLFGIGLIAMGLVEFCALGVTLLWQFMSINFKSLEYLVYIFAIILFFASAAGSLKPKNRKLTWVFLMIISIIIAGLYLINPVLSGPGVYSARYVLSFDNPTTINVFALIVALSFGLATLTASSKLADSTTRTFIEMGFLVVIAGLVLNILSYSDNTKLIASIAGELALIVILAVLIRSELKLKKHSK